MTVIPILWHYLGALSLVIMAVFILGIVILTLYPSKKLKVAVLWIAVGIIQITLWGLYAFPLVFNYFPSQTAFGIFLLTSGISLYCLNQAKRSKKERMLAAISLLVIGLTELFVFINFYFTFPNIKQWNTMIDATSYIAFLIAAISTFVCAIILLAPAKR